MDNLKLSYELDRLEDLVEERVRLTSVIKIQPSSRDNINLKQQLSKTLNLLNDIANVEEDGKIVGEYSTRYSEILQEVPDKAIDLSLYEFKVPIRSQSPDESTQLSLPRDLTKKVRFKDDDLVSYNEVEQFRPYHDEPHEASDQKFKDVVDDDRIKLLPQDEPSQPDVISPGLTNQELFIQQQQQLLEQDTHLNFLSDSVRKTHDISLDINQEVTEQNDQVLHDLESLVENSGRNLDRAKRRLETFEKTARENGPCLIILLLIMILILLLVAL